MSRPSDRLALLETFARIAEAGSIGAAARDLGLSQPTASRQLAELEARLRTTLIRRTTHELALTDAGEALLDTSRALLSGWDALEERHLGDAHRLAGRLRVVAPVALGQTLLSGLACRFQAELERLVLLALEPFEGRAVPLENARGQTVTVRPPVRLTTNNIAALREATLGGLGIAVLPRWFIGIELGRGALVEPLPGWRAPTLPVSAAYSRNRYPPRRLGAFVDLLVAAVPELLSGRIEGR